MKLTAWLTAWSQRTLQPSLSRHKRRHRRSGARVVGVPAQVLEARTLLAGTGLFVAEPQVVEGYAPGKFSLGDLDGDGDLDVVEGEVLLNDGVGVFAPTGQRLAYGHAIALGDVDGDGDLDAFVLRGYSAYREVWLNDGTGHFIDTGQRHEQTVNGKDIVMADFDGDGDLDAFIGNN